MSSNFVQDGPGRSSEKVVGDLKKYSDQGDLLFKGGQRRGMVMKKNKSKSGVSSIEAKNTSDHSNIKTQKMKDRHISILGNNMVTRFNNMPHLF